MSANRKEMAFAQRRLRKALQSANEACAELEIQAHLSIKANNVKAPWDVRSVAMNTRQAIVLAQTLALDLMHKIPEVKT